MRILLVRPPHPRLTIGLEHLMRTEPLELEYLAAALGEHEVRLLDLQLEGGLRRTLREFRPEIVATTCYITGVNEAIRVCRQARRQLPGVLTVVGGVHATVVPEDLADASVSAIALTGDVSLLPELAEALESGRPLEDVPGLALPMGRGEVRTTAPRPYLPDLPTLPRPRRDLTAHLAHRYRVLYFQPLALVKTTWGCPHACAYCFPHQVTRGRVFARAAEDVVEELAALVAPDVYIVDDDLFHDPDRAWEIARALSKSRVRKRILAYGRADFIAGNEELVQAWRAAGLTALMVGLEATTDAELRTLGKSTRADDNRAALAVLRRNHVDAHALFVPHPDYTEADWDALERFVAEEELYFINLTPLTPYPGTPTWTRMADQVQVPRQAHGLWDMVHPVVPTHLPLRTWYRRTLRLYLRTTLDPRISSKAAHSGMPPLYSRRFWRTLAGSARAGVQLASAPWHHSRAGLALASWKGREP